MRKTSLVIIASLLMPTVVQAAQQEDGHVCFADAYGVKRHTPESHPSWTYRMPGHEGEKCWFPATKDNKKWHPTASKSNKINNEPEVKKVHIEIKEPNKIVAPTTRSIVIDPPIEIKIVEQPVIAKTNDSEWSVAYRFEAYANRLSTDKFMQWASSLF